MCMEFALAADPSSEVFKGMSCSRRTVVRRMNDIYSYICDEIKDDVRSLFILLMSDESMDTSVTEQLIVYLRHVDATKEKLLTRFVGVCKISGHPTAENLFKAIDELLTQYKVLVLCSLGDVQL